MGIFQIGTARIIAAHALEALTSHYARAATLGTEMRDARGSVVARKVRVLVECIFVEVWQPTEAWPETLAPAPDLGTDRGSHTEACREPTELFPSAAQLAPLAKCGEDATT